MFSEIIAPDLVIAAGVAAVAFVGYVLVVFVRAARRSRS